MKCVMSCWVMLVVASCAPAVAGAACADPRAVAATRAAADAQCSCSAATNHKQYVKCVAGVANASVKHDHGGRPDDHDNAGRPADPHRQSCRSASAGREPEGRRERPPVGERKGARVRP